MSGISSFINWDLLFNLSNSDLENLIFNYRVCHLARISLMMLLPSSRTPQQILPPALTHIESSIQIRAPTEKISHFLCLSCIRVLSSSWNKMSWQRNFCKIYFFAGTSSPNCSQQITENYKHQFCLAPSLYHLLGKCFVLEDCKHIFFPILCKFNFPFNLNC